jgi:arylsulfatase A-like enzyme
MFYCLAFLSALAFQTTESQKPNILLIMADDVGVEAFSSYGGESYHTPNIDALAEQGMQFSHCYSQPLCTPSRIKLLTGKSNLRNYVRFSILDRKERTFAHLAKGAGYSTAIAGKWQLLGASHYGEWAGRGTTPNQAGFDSWCLWQVGELGSRYWNPQMEVDGELQDPVQGGFGPDLSCQHLLDFAAEHRTEPFLAYFPMALVHSPFVHTPLTRTEQTAEVNPGSKQERFAEMMTYMDVVVGRLVSGLDALGLRERTLIVFIGDNGTSRGIQSVRNGQNVMGAKAHPIDAGTHVPLIASWPGRIEPGTTCDDLIDFSDFMPTIAEAIGQSIPSGQVCDGYSFLPQLLGQTGHPREFITIYSNPRPEDPTKNPRICFARNKRFKLYDDGRMFDCVEDSREEHPLSVGEVNHEQRRAHKMLQEALKDLPIEPPHLRGASQD